MGYCDGLSRTSAAFAICREMETTLSLSSAEVDSPSCRVKHAAAPHYPAFKCQKPDGHVTTDDVYASAFKIAESEEYENALQLRQHACSEGSQDQFTFKDGFAKKLAESGVHIPWIATDADDATDPDKELFQKVMTDARSIINGAVNDPKVKNCKTKRRLALAVMDYIVRPKSSGGLGIKFDFKQNEKDRTMVDVVASGLATCTEFTCLFIFVARQVGLDAQPVQIYENEFGRPITHVAVGVKIPEGDVVLDLSLSRTGYIQGKGRWSFISKNDLFAYVMMNRAKEKEGESGSEEQRYLDLAFEAAPQNYLVLQNLGRREWEKGNFGSAKTYLKASIDLNPFTPETYYFLSAAYKATGANSKATRLCQKYKSLGGAKDCK